MPNPEPVEGNNSPDLIHNAEQMWAEADEHLGDVLKWAESILPSLYLNAGGNTDISVIYDWWKAYIVIAEQHSPESHSMTIVMCCAALTRLMRHDDRMRADTVLAQLEKEIDT